MSASVRSAPSSAAEKWSQWQSAVETGRNGVNRSGEYRLNRLRGVEERADRVLSSVSVDAVIVRFADRENSGVRASFERYGRWNTENFQPLAMLGEGAFGIVHLVRHKDTSALFALKQMDKTRYRQKNRQRAFTERDALAEARSRWCVELFATFQDAGYVYMVMEFLQGGDLIGHLQRRRRFTTAETAFYMAELLEALDTVHRCGFVHRDVKPDNVVIGISGHLKLLDFGLCKSDDLLDQRDSDGNVGTPTSADRKRLHSVVGTPQYMSPEGFSGHFGTESDLWALGIITFECLVGVVPFHSGRHQGPEAIAMIRKKIIGHADLLPEKLEKARRLGFVAAESERFLRAMICSRGSRLSAAQIRGEPFFSSIDFPGLHLVTPPFLPEVTSPEDVSHFDSFRRSPSLPKVGPRLGWDRRLEWAHYEIDSKAVESQHLCEPDVWVEHDEVFEV